MLVTLGDQDIDLSPTFTIFLSTRDPTVRAGHSGRPGHRPVAHIHHLPLHPGPHGTCWSPWETRTSTCRPHSPSSSPPGTPRYVLVTLGDQDIDLSPTFTIFLSTRDPTVRAGHPGRPGHRPVAHIHHLPLHPGPHGTCWSLWETRTSTCRPHSPSSSPAGTPRYDMSAVVTCQTSWPPWWPPSGLSRANRLCRRVPRDRRDNQQQQHVICNCSCCSLPPPQTDQASIVVWQLLEGPG